jgi:PAS domain-containing protein
VNNAYCGYFQKSAEELLGQPFFLFIPKGDHNIVKESLATSGKEHSVETIEHHMLLPNGEVCWQQWIYHCIADNHEDGKPWIWGLEYEISHNSL